MGPTTGSVGKVLAKTCSTWVLTLAALESLNKNMFYVGPDTGSIGKVLAQTCSQLPLLTTLISTVNCYLTQLPE